MDHYDVESTERFQSTLPVRGATLSYDPLVRVPGDFQSTLPVRGATKSAIQTVPPTPFQSTLPVRGATRILADHINYLQISIHAPREGSDQGPSEERGGRTYFNPRSP